MLLPLLLACGWPRAGVVDPIAPAAPTGDTGLHVTEPPHTGRGTPVDPTGDTGTPEGTGETGLGETGGSGHTGEPPEPDPGAALFATTHQVDLLVDPVFVETLRLAPTTWVPGTLIVDGLVLADVGLRLKGHGSFQPIDAKPSFKIALDTYVEDQELDGLDELVLQNMSTDPTGLREHAAYAVYRHLGVPAPRSVHVTVDLNGAPIGTYLLLEDVDGRYLNRWFDDNDGPLYEMFDVDLTPPEVYLLDHDGGPDERDVVMRLAEVLVDPTSDLMVDAAPYLNLDTFVAYFGASAVIGQFDAYPYSFPGDDVYLYVDPTDDRVHMLPHGGDETFRDPDRPVDFVFGLLATRCLASAVCEERFDAAVWAAMDGVEQMDLLGQFDGWTRELPPAALVVNTAFTEADVEAERAEMRAFVEGRRARLDAMPGLEGP